MLLLCWLLCRDYLCTGLNDVARDHTKAAQLLQTVADRGSGGGMWRLGNCYLYGYGVPNKMKQRLLNCIKLLQTLAVPVGCIILVTAISIDVEYHLTFSQQPNDTIELTQTLTASIHSI